MKRTLHTAQLLFRDNSGFDDMAFIVHPLLRERVHVSADLLSTNDLSKRVDQWQSRFGINPATKAAKLTLYLSAGWDVEEGGTKAALEHIKNVYPASIESLDRVRERTN